MRDPDSGPVLEALAATTAALDATGLPHMLIGGLAVAASGYARPTTDIDATIWAPRPNFETLLAVLQDGGLEPRIPTWRRLAEEARMLLLRHVEGVDVDLSLALLPFELDAISRSRRVRFVGQQVQIPELGDLIAQKAAAFRPADISDIEELAKLTGADLDIDTIVARFTPIAEAIGVPERAHELRRLLSAASGATHED